MNFLCAQLWLFLQQVPRALWQGLLQRASAWEKETGTKPRFIFLAAVLAVVWAFVAILFVGWVGDLIRYVA